MPRSRRKTLFNNTALSMVGSDGAVLGVFPVAGFSRLTGLVSIVGSATLRIRTGATSGTYAVTSTSAVNSGGNTFDSLLFGPVVEVALTPASSQTATIALIGDTMARGF